MQNGSRELDRRDLEDAEAANYLFGHAPPEVTIIPKTLGIRLLLSAAFIGPLSQAWAQPAASSSAGLRARPAAVSLANEDVQAALDLATGGFVSIYDKRSGSEYVGTPKGSAIHFESNVVESCALNPSHELRLELRPYEVRVLCVDGR